jgi:FKBP-type peptidyl-prolyl cis-trans isomerase
MNTQTQIFNYIQGLNPQTSVISSIGNFVDSNNQQLADNLRNEVMAALPADSLAYNIASTANQFSTKQLWVIAFELIKNENFVSKVATFYNELSQEVEADRQRKTAKRAAKKVKEQEIKATVAANIEKYNQVEGGIRVKHASFGEGVILSQDDKVVKVLFETVGEKQLLKAYAKLEIL